MKFLTVKNARLLGGGAAVALALTAVIPGKGQAFRLPGFSLGDFWNFWLPAAVAVASFVPGVIPNGRLVSGVGLLVLGGRRLIAGQFQPSLNNVVFTYVPVLTGFRLAV